MLTHFSMQLWTDFAHIIMKTTRNTLFRYSKTWRTLTRESKKICILSWILQNTRTLCSLTQRLGYRFTTWIILGITNLSRWLPCQILSVRLTYNNSEYLKMEKSWQSVRTTKSTFYWSIKEKLNQQVKLNPRSQIGLQTNWPTLMQITKFMEFIRRFQPNYQATTILSTKISSAPNSKSTKPKNITLKI